MSKWRPDGWEEKRRKYTDGVRNNNYWGLEAVCASEGFEAGADAMLDALRTRTNYEPRTSMSFAGDGKLIFIPDDPKEKTYTVEEARDLLSKARTASSEKLKADIQKMWDKFWRNHPYAKVIESGYFCKYCGKQYSGSQIKTCRFTERYGGDEGRGIG